MRSRTANGHRILRASKSVPKSSTAPPKTLVCGSPAGCAKKTLRRGNDAVLDLCAAGSSEWAAPTHVGTSGRWRIALAFNPPTMSRRLEEEGRGRLFIGSKYMVDYVRQRLSAADMPEELFERDALGRIASYSGDNFRDANTLCDRVLQTSQTSPRKQINSEVVDGAAKDVGLGQPGWVRKKNPKTTAAPTAAIFFCAPGSSTCASTAQWYVRRRATLLPSHSARESGPATRASQSIPEPPAAGASGAGVEGTYSSPA